MEINVCHPLLTLGENDKANRFYTVFVEYVNQYAKINTIKSKEKIREVEYNIEKSQILILFNAESYSDEIRQLVRKAIEKNAIVWPIGLCKNDRMPIEEIRIKQSFDISSNLENRKNDSNISAVAQVFARMVLAESMPTFCREHKKLLFVSHRRLDGEDIAAKLCDKIYDFHREANTFRDVVEVAVGENAQEVIDSALAVSDALVFLHTPKSVDSEWIQKEVLYALMNGIPILWIRIDQADIEALRVRPSENPHMECESKDFEDEAKLEEYVDRIEDICFKLVINNRYRVFDYHTVFENFYRQNGIEFNMEDKEQQIYKIVYDRNRAGIYPCRKMVQYIQFFGRTIKPEDNKVLEEFLCKKHTNEEPLYDSAVMLSMDEHFKKQGTLLKNGYNEHIKMWKKELNKIMNFNGKCIILSGAFPDCEEWNKQVLTESVSIFAQEIISCGYTLVFGAHPTFQKLIFEIGKAYSEDPKKSIKMYISQNFQYNLHELEEYATICEVERENDVQQSLKNLREKMIKENHAEAMICMGGKKKENQKEQGVDAEIEIAVKNNIPVFLIGSAGGLTAERAAAYGEKENWNEINDASNELNLIFKDSIDYRLVFGKLQEYLNNR